MSDSAMAGASASAPKLDDLMLAMDVVDTLRHDQRLVERELLAAVSDEALIKRLREVYKSQGIEVSDRVLEEGVKALNEKRFSYEPPGPSLARSLALAWIERARIGKILLGTFLAVFAVWLSYDFFIARPQRAAQAYARKEITELLPKALVDDYSDVMREAKIDAARQHAAQLLADGKAALARGAAAAARKASDDMRTLLNDLRAEFALRIVNRPGEASGVWREPAINPQARNYYLIVEPVTPDGKILTRPILNEETGITSRVDKWGVRVGRDLFEKVIEDKRENGLIDRNIVGNKRRGYLDVDYVVPILGGAITKW
jgi:Family of unknown function (DUF6384)